MIMGLEYRILASKPKIKLKSNFDGNEYVETMDLAACTFKGYQNIMCEDGDESGNNDFCVVNEYYEARPDLISLAFYGTDKYGDFICKYNGISNPFELGENTILVIPKLSAIQSGIQHSKSSELISTEKTNYIGAATNTYKKYNNERRTPNEQTINDTNFVIDKVRKLVFY